MARPATTDRTERLTIIIGLEDGESSIEIMGQAPTWALCITAFLNPAKL
jgi:hypothetical protein